MDSGAADQIVRRFMKLFGEKRAGWALMASGFLLSIPVFFDTVFFLLVPLARMLGIRTGKNYMFVGARPEPSSPKENRAYSFLTLQALLNFVL